MEQDLRYRAPHGGFQELGDVNPSRRLTSLWNNYHYSQQVMTLKTYAHASFLLGRITIFTDDVHVMLIVSKSVEELELNLVYRNTSQRTRIHNSMP